MSFLYYNAERFSILWSYNELAEIIKKKNSGNKHCSFCEFQ